MPKHDSSQRAAHLLRALEGTDICVFYQNSDLVYDWIENPPEGWTVEGILGRTDTDILPPEVAELTISRKQAVLQNGKSDRLDLEIDSEEGVRAFDVYVEPDCDDDDNIQGLLCFAVDVTVKKRREHNMRELLLEVSHRSRNMLAIVQSLANHSLRSPGNAPMLARFNERLQSLASTLTVVTRSDWDGAHLHELTRAQVTPFLQTGSVLDISGPDLEITPNAAIHVGLALQELAANSALEKRAPIVGSDIGISIVRSDDHVVMRWHERTDYRAAGEDLDAVTLRKIVPLALGGDAKLEHDEGLFTYTLTFPAQNLR